MGKEGYVSRTLISSFRAGGTVGALSHSHQVSALFIWLWIAGGFPAAVLGEVVRAESPRIARAGRIAFALLLWVDLLVAAVFLSVGADAPSAHMTRSLWWVTIVLGGVPLAIVSGLAVRRGYVGNRLGLFLATLATAVLYLAFPLSFTPRDEPRLTRLGRFAHDHHLLALAILLIPTVILLANELRWKGQVAPGPEEGRASLRSRIRMIPKGNLIGAVVLLLALMWMAGTNSSGMLLGLAVLLVGSGLLLWRKNRSVMRSVLKDLRPPEKS
jgi:hypothetical protein